MTLHSHSAPVRSVVPVITVEHPLASALNPAARPLTDVRLIASESLSNGRMLRIGLHDDVGVMLIAEHRDGTRRVHVELDARALLGQDLPLPNTNFANGCWRWLEGQMDPLCHEADTETRVAELIAARLAPHAGQDTAPR